MFPFTLKATTTQRDYFLKYFSIAFIANVTKKLTKAPIAASTAVLNKSSCVRLPKIESKVPERVPAFVVLSKKGFISYPPLRFGLRPPTHHLLRLSSLQSV